MVDVNKRNYLSFVTVLSDYINFNKISPMYDLTVTMIRKGIQYI